VVIAHNMNTLNATECTFKMVNFMLCIFCYNKKERKHRSKSFLFDFLK
jgi:hypothetical protein